jgi:glycerol-3-phosphate acyltransferase PlsY
MTTLVLLLAVSYLMGSCPTSMIVSRWARGIDIRQHGSGNAGGTNVLRVVGWRAALVVVVVDVGKGFGAAFLPKLTSGALPIDGVTAATFCGTAAVIGHVYPVFASFRGGKGVGTAAGALLALHPLAAAICAPVFIVVVAATRMVSLGSMVAALSMPMAVVAVRGGVWAREEVSALLPLVAVSLFILFTHRTNIGRILKGTENKFGSSRK